MFSILVELEFGDVGFCEGRKTGDPEEKTLGTTGENQQQTQPTYDTGPEANPAIIGERPTLLPVRHASFPHSDRKSTERKNCPRYLIPSLLQTKMKLPCARQAHLV